MNFSLKKTLKISLPILLGLALIAYSYYKFTPEQLKNIIVFFKKANYWYLFLAVLLGLLSHLSRAYRWQFLLQPLGYKPKVLNNIMAIGIAYLMNLGVPRSGEFARALVIDKYDNVPFNKAFGTIIAERLVDLFMLSACLILALILQFKTLKSYLTTVIPLQKLLILLIVIIVIIGLVFFIVKNTRNTIMIKVKTFLFGLKEGVLSLLKMKQKGAFIIHTLSIWILYFLMFYVPIFALPETKNIPLDVMLLSFVVGGITIAFTNSGFGSYPFFIASVMALFAIPEAVGTAFGWIVWMSQFILILFYGGLSFLLLPFYNRKYKKSQPY